MKKELNVFLTAVMYYTRIPCGRWVSHKSHQLHKATRYFPLVGWIVGLFSALVLIVANYLFNPSIAILFSMAASVLLTGAFHEDGFADFCDGFGGGWTKEKILEIMKDSRIGTYGVVGLLLLLGMKFLALQQLITTVEKEPALLALLLVVAHAVSRFTAASFIFTHPYVRLSADSKVKPVAERTTTSTLVLAFVFAVVPILLLVLLLQQYILFALIVPLYLLKLYFGWYFTKWIGGYTGDCLGAVQQVAEITIYLTVLLLWKFI